MNYRLISLLLAALIISIVPVFATQMNLTYDANGNKVSGDDGFYRVYNSLNQLWRVYNSTISGALVQEYTYHPTEERVWTKKTFYSNGSLQENVIYFTKSHVRVINSSGTFDTRYVYDDGQMIAQKNADNTTYFIIGDNIGSNTVVTNASGVVLEANAYSPFGELLNKTVLRYGYEGKEQDLVLGDTDFNFRRYNSITTLFMQPDTILPNVYDPQQLNRYSFERNDPYNNQDETGHELKYTNPITGAQVSIPVASDRSDNSVGSENAGYNSVGFSASASNFVAAILGELQSFTIAREWSQNGLEQARYQNAYRQYLLLNNLNPRDATSFDSPHSGYLYNSNSCIVGDPCDILSEPSLRNAPYFDARIIQRYSINDVQDMTEKSVQSLHASVSSFLGSASSSSHNEQVKSLTTKFDNFEASFSLSPAFQKLYIAAKALTYASVKSPTTTK